MANRRRALGLLAGIPFVAPAKAASGSWTYHRWKGTPLPGHDRLEVVGAVPPEERARPPRAVLVLCPGFNGDGGRLVADPDWQAFALEHRIGLAGLSFASPVDLLRKRLGYYQVENGSGDALLEGLDHLFPPGLPILLSGFSGGAHFTGRFAVWKPDRVLTFSLLGAGDFANCEIEEGADPPGLLGCGTRDFRFGGTEIFFSAGREKGRRWAMAPLEGANHHPVREFTELTQLCFAAHLGAFAERRPMQGHWIDRGTLEEVDPTRRHPGLTCWLPDDRSLAAWTRLAKAAM